MSEKLKKDFILYIEATFSDAEFLEDIESILFNIYALNGEDDLFDEMLEKDDFEFLKEDALFRLERFVSSLKKEKDLLDTISLVLDKDITEIKDLF